MSAIGWLGDGTRNLAIAILRLTGHADIAAALHYHARQAAADDHAMLKALNDAGPRRWRRTMRMPPSPSRVDRPHIHQVANGARRGSPGEILHDVVLGGFVRALDDLEAVLAGVAPGRWDAPSPCQGWCAADVAGHVIGDLRAVEAYATGRHEAGRCC